MKRRIFSILLLVIVGSLPLYAQKSVRGKVVDEFQNPVAYANVQLLEAVTFKVWRGVVSDLDGNYVIDQVLDGSFMLEVSFFGFKTARTPVFDLTENDSDIVRDFVLEEDVKSLDEVEVKASRPVILRTGDKLVVDLENSERINANLSDVLKNVPGIIITNGSISYGGQTGIRILINGNTSDYMDVATLLRDFPADNIAKVEFIQQPGAEYDAEGTGPLINVVLKKNVKFGTNGNGKLYTGYDNQPEYGASGMVSCYVNRLNWQIGAGYKRTAWREDLFIRRYVGDKLYDQGTISPYRPGTWSFNGVLGYHLGQYQMIGLGINLTHTLSDRQSSNSTGVIGESNQDTLWTKNDYNNIRSTYNFNPNYKLENDSDYLALDLNLVFYNNDNVNTLYQVGQSQVLYNDQRYFQNGSYKILTLKGDYKHTFNENSSWMIGFKNSNVWTDSYLQSFQKVSFGDFEPNTDQSNRFLVNERIFAIYSKLNKDWPLWHISAGLRWENSLTKGRSTNPEKTRSRRISKPFPSIIIRRDVSEQISVNISYNYRIERPSYNSLNSFVYYYDPYSFEKGNPNLLPEYTNSFQMDVSYDTQPFFTVSYKVTDDALFEMITQDDSNAQISRSMVNLEKRKNWNLSLFAPLTLLENMGGYTGIIANYNNYLSNDFSPILNLDKWSLTWYTSLEYDLPLGFHSELTGYYTTGGLQGQIEYDWLCGLNFAMGKSMVKEKLKMNVGIEEIFNRKFKGIINYGNIIADITSDWSRQNVYLQFTYSFGTKLTKEREKRNPSEEEQNRIKDNN